MSKAEQIRDLYAIGLTIKEIAIRVGCRPEYVRVYARQRIQPNSGYSRIDERYLRRKWRTKNLAEAFRRAHRYRRQQLKLYPLEEAA